MIKRKKLLKKIGVICLSLLSLVPCMFIGVSAAGDSQDYIDGYNDGYNEAFENFNTFSAIENYYLNSINFVSSNSGASYSSTSAVSSYRSGVNLVIVASNGFSTLPEYIYYVDITFSTPFNLKNVILNATGTPSPLKVVVSNVEYSFTYTQIDGVGKMWSNNIYTMTSNIKFYFRGRPSSSNSFSIQINAYQTALEGYQNGYEDGRNSLTSTIEAYEETIDSKDLVIDNLQSENARLNEMLSNVNGSWQSLFFAMADTPFKTISSALGFDLFGMNLFSAFIGILTVLAIFFIFKKIIK